jgi:hypothetical protein
MALRADKEQLERANANAQSIDSEIAKVSEMRAILQVYCMFARCMFARCMFARCVFARCMFALLHVCALRVASAWSSQSSRRCAVANLAPTDAARAVGTAGVR